MHKDLASEKLLAVLNRYEKIPAMESLSNAIKNEITPFSLRQSAIVIDTNVFLRIPNHPKYEDITDYLTSVHESIVLIPGQAIQEFWNNHYSAIDTIYNKLEKKYNEFNKELDRLDTNNYTMIPEIQESLNRFKDENEHIFDPLLLQKTSTFIDTLISKATVSFAPRDKFSSMARSRKLSKTPPGFKDEGDGDFWVWVDLLYGLFEEKCNSNNFNSVILLTLDRKKDWISKNSPHPILSAEVEAVLNSNLIILTIDELADEINKSH